MLTESVGQPGCGESTFEWVDMYNPNLKCKVKCEGPTHLDIQTKRIFTEVHGVFFFVFLCVVGVQSVAFDV